MTGTVGLVPLWSVSVCLGEADVDFQLMVFHAEWALKVQDGEAVDHGPFEGVLGVSP